MLKGQVISGKFGEILIRQKSDKNIELGELLIANTPDGKILLQVYDLIYGSQISQQNLELISGMQLEEKADFDFLDRELRNYTLGKLKNLIQIKENSAIISKSLPSFFSEVREITKEDLSFLTKPKNPLYLGKLRSGSKALDVDIFLPGIDVLSHHILIVATTGRGKSNLTSVMLWNLLDHEYGGILVLDPHDEYYGRNGIGLKDHKNRQKVVYYSDNPPTNGISLRINLQDLVPEHFNGVVYLSDPQKQALSAYYQKFGKDWIKAIIQEKQLENVRFHEDTLAVIKRRLISLLNIEIVGNTISFKGIFQENGGETTTNNIVNSLEEGKTVIIDTSNFSGATEILIGSIIASKVLYNYKQYKVNGLKDKPVISIVIEEAPRVLGKETLEKGSNIFEEITREGRKFKVGLFAITQIPSLIPRSILANINTKIILGLEMAPERQAIIESASQDLSEDNRNIASLDKGEAIITSNFTKFATPIKIPLFSEIVKNSKDNYKLDYGL